MIEIGRFNRTSYYSARWIARRLALSSFTKDRTNFGQFSLDTTNAATPLEQQDIAPPAVAGPPQALPAAQCAEPVRLKQGQACLVFGKNTGLQGPNACLFALLDQGEQKARAQTLALVGMTDIDAGLRDAGIDAPVGNAGKAGPTNDRVIYFRDQAGFGQAALVEVLPLAGIGREGGIARGNALGVDLAHHRPVASRHLADSDGRRGVVHARLGQP